MTRISNYAKAVMKWYSEGRPVRTDLEVEHLLEKCKSCDKYDENRSICKICGCNVNLSQNALFNKLRMATEHCPIGKW